MGIAAGREFIERPPGTKAQQRTEVQGYNKKFNSIPSAGTKAESGLLLMVIPSALLVAIPLLAAGGE